MQNIPQLNQQEIEKALTRIFHTDLLRSPGSLMDAALSSKSSSSSMDSYSRRQTSSLALPHKPSLPPHNDQYEICGLTQALEECLSAKGFRADQINPHFVYRIFKLRN